MTPIKDRGFFVCFFVKCLLGGNSFLFFPFSFKRKSFELFEVVSTSQEVLFAEKAVLIPAA